MKKFSTVKKLWLAALLVLVLGAMLCMAVGAETLSGTCGAEGDGSNLTWTLNTETGELVIKGSGKMMNYQFDPNIEQAPWHSESIKSVNVESGVTSIGYSAFSDLDNLTSVTIGDSLETIGFYSFQGCDGLVSVTIPDNVIFIDNYAFDSCTSLESVTICGETRIGDGAFNGCNALRSVTLLSKNAEIYDSVFTFPTSATIYGYADSTAEAYAEKYGRTFADISALLVYGDCGEALTWILTKDGELIISGTGEMADYSIALSTPAPWYSYRSSIKTITIGDDVTSIGNYAFYGCSEITDITIPKGVASIGTEALSMCGKLETIMVAEDNEVYHSAGNCLIETETGLLVAGCNTSVIPTDGSVTAIGGFAFFGSTGLDEVIIPDSVTSIGTAAFQTCTALKSIRIPESVTLISQEAFNACSALSEIVILSGTVEIVDDKDEFATIPQNATIYGYKDSTAEEYAADYGRRFVILGETEDLSMISYQVTKGEGGKFSLRLISGMNSLNYSYFGYEVTVTTKDAEGNDVVKIVSGKSDRVYSSVYGGSTAYSVKDNFGYEYAGLATVTGLALDSEYIKIEVRSYVYLDGERLYGDGATLTYTGTADANGYPALTFDVQ